MPTRPPQHRHAGWKPYSASGWNREPRTGSSTARGYGVDWRRVRERRLAAEPLCRFCAEVGRVTAATQVDHIVAFKGLGDPLRLDLGNTRALCEPCHMSRTQGQSLPGPNGIR